MFVLIWATLLVSVRGSHAETGPSRWTGHCTHGVCFNPSEIEITAEAGLCVVIPCSFNLIYGFTTSIVWYKCKPDDQRCDSDMILRYDRKVQSGLRGRISLLEPNLSQKNCSIIINDVTESDSGSYQPRVTSLPFGEDGFIYSPRVNVLVKDLIQKPTVMIPPLTEGQQTTLTCTAPGLCSGSEPEITWTWRGAGGKDSHITGNITAFQTEILTAVTRRHSSTLTFNPLVAQHHGTEVTCKVGFTNGITTEETLTLNVTLYLKILNGSKCEVQSRVLTCLCISEGFPLPTIKWPLLENQPEYFVTTTVSNHTVSSAITLTVKDHSSTSVECVSSSEVGEMQEIATITTLERREADQHGPRAVLPWVIIAVVSLIVNIICIILLIFLWNTRRKVKPDQEDRPYMSLQKTHPSPEYDVVLHL